MSWMQNIKKIGQLCRMAQDKKKLAMVIANVLEAHERVDAYAADVNGEIQQVMFVVYSFL